MDRCKWRKMIKEARWSGWVWVGERFFWYRPTRVVPDQRPLNGRCCCCYQRSNKNFDDQYQRSNNNFADQKKVSPWFSCSNQCCLAMSQHSFKAFVRPVQWTTGIRISYRPNISVNSFISKSLQLWCQTTFNTNSYKYTKHTHQHCTNYSKPKHNGKI